MDESIINNVNVNVNVQVKTLNELVSIEYPCFVSSTKKAIDMINGENVIKSILNNKQNGGEQVLRLNLHNRANLYEQLLPTNVDMLRSPLISKYTNNESHITSLVIRLKRKRKRNVVGKNDLKEVVKLEVVGKISETYEFPYPADIQVF